MKKYPRVLNNRTIIYLILILVLAFSLRIYKVASVPPNLGNDEISIAYDSYSLLKTGKDSSGKLLPLSFKSHNTYKAPLYAYVAMPFVGLIGNNELAIRFPSIFFGSLTVLVLYFLIWKITNNRVVAIISSFLLAITPWHVYTSRIAYESNIALFFLILGIYIFMLGIEKPKNLILSAITLSLSIYSYHTEWIFVPIIMLFLGLVNFKRKLLRTYFYWFTLVFILVLPLIIDFILVKNNTRAVSEFILNDFELANRISGVGNLATKVFIIFNFWIDKYLGYLDIRFIFTRGMDISADYQASDFGLLNLITLPLFFVGVFYFFQSNITIRDKLLIIFWFVVGPLIPSLTLGEINLVRNLVSIVPWLVIISYGVFGIVKKYNKFPVLIIMSILIAINFSFFYRYYIKSFPVHFAENWQYGYKQIAQFTDKHYDKYNEIVIDPHFGVVNNKFIGVPLLYILYFNEVDPNSFLSDKEEIEGGIRYDKYVIRNIDWTHEEVAKDSLYVVSLHSNPLKNQKVREVENVKLPGGITAFKLYEGF